MFNIQVILQGETSATTKPVGGGGELTLSSDGGQQHEEGVEGAKGGQMNMRGVYLHILGDALGSVIVIIAALIVKYVKGKWTLYVDPALSIIMVS